MKQHYESVDMGVKVLLLGMVWFAIWVRFYSPDIHTQNMALIFIVIAALLGTLTLRFSAIDINWHASTHAMAIMCRGTADRCSLGGVHCRSNCRTGR